jgi:hypothetical protein
LVFFIEEATERSRLRPSTVDDPRDCWSWPKGPVVYFSLLFRGESPVYRIERLGAIENVVLEDKKDIEENGNLGKK